MSLRVDLEVYASVRFPRVSGDEPPMACATAMKLSFSPRERG